MTMTLGTYWPQDGADAMSLDVDLPRLLETRMLVQANSGGGKSWLLRRLLEQTATSVQQIVIDPEGEFATLREQFDYIIAAPHDADVVANPKTAALLAKRLLETGVSAVLDIYDLKAGERQAFVQRFLHGLVNAPRALWHPVLLVIDEAHIFCPQSGGAEAAAAVIDVCTRGRKRGLCPVLATQRLSKLHKDAAAEMLNKLVGRTSLDIDVKRAADELGMSTADERMRIRRQKAGEFFAYGPALVNDVSRLQVGPVQTTHPQAGDRLMAPPPAPTKKVRDSLAKLADLQTEAEKETADVESLRADVARLNRELVAARRGAGQAASAGPTEAEIQRRIEMAVVAAKKLEPAAGNDSEKALRRIVEHAMQIGAIAGRVLQVEPTSVFPIGKEAGARKGMPQSARAPATASAGLTGPEQRILDAIAWMNAIGVPTPEQTAVAFMAGYTIGGGAWNNPRGSLRTKGLIAYNGKELELTDAGRELANAPSVAPGTEALHDAIKARLPGPETKLLAALLEAYPEGLSNDELAARAGYAPKGGAYNNPRGRLRSLGLIEYASGQVRARDILFPEADRG